jgi:hypothetical protein
MLMKHAPMQDATFHVTFEGELFSVDRKVSGDPRPLLDEESRLSSVVVYDYQPPVLDALIGRQMPLVPRAEAHPPESSWFLVGRPVVRSATPETDPLVSIVDTYKLI